MEFNEITHRGHVFGAVFTALHTDVEYPCCSVVFLAGFRVEWDYNWSEALQSENNADVMDVNFLFTAGLRF